MQVIFTSMNERNVLSVCDLKTRKITHVPTPTVIDDHRPFGITWCRERIYVAQPTSLMIFDKNLNYLGVYARDFWYGTHQILYYDNLLWMVSPRINAVIRFSPEKTDYFFPDEGVVRPNLSKEFHNKDKMNFSRDVSHYNSIFIKKDKLYLSAHNHDNPSFIKIFSYPDLKFLRKIPNLGKQIHNVFFDKNLWTIDSLGTRSLVSDDRKIIIGGERQFVRGLAVSKDVFVTSCFPYDPVRHKRRDGHSEIVVADRNKLQVIDRILVPNVGNINDIRLLDCRDEAHNDLILRNQTTMC